MKSLRRKFVPGAAYFFTVVTHERRPILTGELARSLLSNAFQNQQARRPFTIPAIVLLPDHLHTIWQLSPGDDNYPLRWRQIKERFTRDYLASGGSEGWLSKNRTDHRERGIWQHRSWEHTIEDEDDFKRCLDYIHWNPVKHNLVSLPQEYPWSSFHRWVKLGEYDRDWGAGEVADVPGAEWE